MSRKSRDRSKRMQRFARSAEKDRAQRELERQEPKTGESQVHTEASIEPPAKPKNGQLSGNVLIHVVPPAPRKQRKGAVLTPEQHEWLEALISRDGESAVIEWLSGLPRARSVQCGARQWGRTSLRSIRKVGCSHNAAGFAVYHELRENYGKPHRGDDPQIRVVTQERSEPVYDPSLRVESVKFGGASIRMVVDEAGLVFVAKDLVEAVGATWSGAKTLEHIPAEYRGVVSVTTPSGVQQMVTLTEAGMNMYLFRSDKPAALPWQKHLAEVVLPSIRKTGRYEDPNRAVPALPTPPVADSMLRDLLVAQQEQTRALTALTTALVSSGRVRGQRSQPPEQEQIPFVPNRKRREALDHLIRAAAGVTHGMDEKEYHDLVRKAWHQLYDAMKSQANIDVRLGKATANARGDDCNYIEWLDSNGYLEIAIEIALKLFAPSDAAE